MLKRAELADRIAQTKVLLVVTRETRAAARNQRHMAALHRALDKLVRPRRIAALLSNPKSSLN